MKLNTFLALGASAPLLTSALYLPASSDQAVLDSQQEPYLVETTDGHTDWIYKDELATPVSYTAPASDEPTLQSQQEKYLVETAPGVQSWITEEDKWDLRRRGINFMDITSTTSLGTQQLHTSRTYTFPSAPAFNSTIHPMLSHLNTSHMQSNLERFTAFHTRFYKSTSGADSSAWLLAKVNETVAASGALKYGATVKPFEHPWGQHSVIARIPGRSNKTVVIGAHQDSINLFLPWFLAAPGADDDGSGTVTILEALRVLLQSPGVVNGSAANTIEFHWYSAEEGGLLGSQAIFSAYEKEGRDVRAMLQQDMTGYVQKTLDAGQKESVGVITDFVNADLTEFIKKIVTEVRLHELSKLAVLASTPTILLLQH